MPQLQFQDFPGRFAAGRQNALGMQRQQQQISAEAQQAPIRNQLNQLNLQQAQVGAQRGERDDAQQQALKRNQMLHQVSKTLLNNIPEEQWPQAIKSLGPQLKALDIDVDLLTQTPTRKEVEQMAQVTGALSNNPEALGRAQKQLQNEFRKQELTLKEKQEERISTKLSAGLEKSLIESQDKTVSAQRASSEFEILANQVDELGGGVATTTTETLKRLLGTQDDVTELRRRFNSIRLSEGLRNLPPGPATDKDMAEAFKGVPPENAPGTQIASFLRGAAKMARFDAAYNQFKSDFISNNSTAKGLNREWRKSVTSTVLGREISIAEIYAEAALEGMTPEEVKQELGVE